MDDTVIAGIVLFVLIAPATFACFIALRLIYAILRGREC